MATNRGTVAHSYHGTAGTAADAVTFSPTANSIMVANRGSSDLYFKTDTQGTADPVVKADGTFVVPAGASKSIGFGSSVTIVKVISASTPEYSVEVAR
jgi:hypothetical protein